MNKPMIMSCIKIFLEKHIIYRVFSIISGKTTMTKLGKCCKFQASNSWPRRALPCLVPGNIYRIPRKALPNRRICLSPRLFCVAGTTGITPVHVVTIVVGGTISSPGFCTTLEIWLLAGPVTSISFTRNITAPTAVNVLLRTCPTMLCPRPTTLIASFPWPCGWWWRMDWPINQPVGIYGEIIAFLFPSPPSKTGWRAGGKKAASHLEGSYLDWALVDFSGYIAADELYDGPFCVLFVVDNRTFKRLLYQVLDYDPGHKDIEVFLRRLEKALRQRGLVLQGVTTDGSPLYPEPLQAVFGDVPHQMRIPHPQGTDQSYLACCGQSAEKTGRTQTQGEAEPAFHSNGQTNRSSAPTVAAENCRSL